MWRCRAPWWADSLGPLLMWPLRAGQEQGEGSWQVSRAGGWVRPTKDQIVEMQEAGGGGQVLATKAPDKDGTCTLGPSFTRGGSSP